LGGKKGDGLKGFGLGVGWGVGGWKENVKKRGMTFGSNRTVDVGARKGGSRERCGKKNNGEKTRAKLMGRQKEGK